ncbi:MAG: DUF2293 domain-containing protein, partial [Planctomycetales bacterium]
MQEIKLWGKRGEPKVPKDYQLIPAGDPYLTRQIKLLSAAIHRAVFVKMRRKRRATRTLGYHAHRDVVKEAQQLKAATEAQRKAKRERARVYRARREIAYQEQFTQRIREMFPGIPNDAPETIAESTCQVGSARVGRSQRLVLDRKVRLAVAASARHSHTDYERRLHAVKGEKRAAHGRLRREIQPQVRSVLHQWR